MAVVHCYHWEEVWPHMRDHARGTTPLAEEALRCLRTYTEPSKAHTKRLLKIRPRITRPPIRPEADPAPRLNHNHLMQFAQISKRAIAHDRVRKP